jgi:hypothetical protein
MAQAVSFRPVTAEAEFRAPIPLYWIYGGHWHCDRFFSEFFGSPCQYHSTVAVHNHITWGMPVPVAAWSEV